MESMKVIRNVNKELEDNTERQCPIRFRNIEPISTFPVVTLNGRWAPLFPRGRVLPMN
jgi:hypothetical protein